MKRKIVLLMLIIFSVSMFFVACGKGNILTLKNVTAATDRVGYTISVNNMIIEGNIIEVNKKKAWHLSLNFETGYTADEEEFKIEIISAKFEKLTTAQVEELSQLYDELLDEGLTEEEIYLRNEFKEYKPFKYTYTKIFNNDEWVGLKISVENLNKNVIFKISGIKEEIINLYLNTPNAMLGKFSYSLNGESYKPIINPVSTIPVQKHLDVILMIRPVNPAYQVPDRLYYFYESDLADYPNSKIYPYDTVTTKELEAGDYTLEFEYIETYKNAFFATENIFYYPVIFDNGAREFKIYQLTENMVLSLSSISSPYYHENFSANTYLLQYETANLLHTLTPLYLNSEEQYIDTTLTNYHQEMFVLKETDDFYFKIPVFVNENFNYNDKQYTMLQKNGHEGLSVRNMAGEEIENALEFVKTDNGCYYYKINKDYITQDLIIVNNGWQITENESTDAVDLPFCNIVDNSGAVTDKNSDIFIYRYRNIDVWHKDKVLLRDNFGISIYNRNKYEYESIEIDIKDTEGTVVRTLTIDDLDKEDTEQYVISGYDSRVSFRWWFDLEVLSGYTFEIKPITIVSYDITVNLLDTSNFQIKYRVLTEQDVKNYSHTEYIEVAANASQIELTLLFGEVLEISVKKSGDYNPIDIEVLNTEFKLNSAIGYDLEGTNDAETQYLIIRGGELYEIGQQVIIFSMILI